MRDDASEASDSASDSETHDNSYSISSEQEEEDRRLSPTLLETLLADLDLSDAHAVGTLAEKYYDVSLAASEGKRYDEACIAVEKATGLQRQILRATVEPPSHSTTADLPAIGDMGLAVDARKTLADHLNHAAYMFLDADRLGQAFQASQEALLIARELCKLDASAHRELLLNCLLTRGDLRFARLEYSLSCKARRKAIELRRELKPSKGDAAGWFAYRVVLARERNKLGIALHHAGEFSDAIDEKLKAVKLQKKVVEQLNVDVNGKGNDAVPLGPGVIREQKKKLAHYSNSLGSSYHGDLFGRYFLACCFKQKAVDIQRSLMQRVDSPSDMPESSDNPALEESDVEDRQILALYLNSLGQSLHERSQSVHRGFALQDLPSSRSALMKEACSTKKEGIALQRAVLKAEPDGNEHRLKLAQYLHSLGTSIHGKGNRRSASAYKREAVELQEKYLEILSAGAESLASSGQTRTQLELWRGKSVLARYLNSYGVSLHGAGRVDEACDAKGRAVQVQREIFDFGPDTMDLKRDKATLVKYMDSHLQSLQASGKEKRQALNRVRRALQTLREERLE